MARSECSSHMPGSDNQCVVKLFDLDINDYEAIQGFSCDFMFIMWWLQSASVGW